MNIGLLIFGMIFVSFFVGYIIGKKSGYNIGYESGAVKSIEILMTELKNKYDLNFNTKIIIKDAK